MEHAALPLAGIRILDCSRVLAGPFATMLMADLGADVIKVEPPVGDDTRTWGPPFWGDRHDGLSAYFTSVNRNKRSVVLDLRTDAGRGTLDELARRADVLVHNYRPATASRLGLDADRLANVHPKLITAVVGGFAGDDNEVRNRAAYDLLAQAVSGLMSVTGDDGGEPHKVGVAVLDLIAGLEVAVATLAALIGRGRVPVQRVEVSLVEAGVTSLVNVLANYLASGAEPRRYGTAHPNIAPYQAFPAADGHIVVAVGNDAQFARFMAVLGLTDDDSRYATNADRLQRREELIAWVGSAIRERERDELVAALLAVDVPAGPVLGVSDAVSAIERSHKDPWVHQFDGISLAPSPFKIDGRRSAIRSGPPRLGEHTEEILAELRTGTVMEESMGDLDETTRREITELEDGLQDALMGPDLEWFEKHWSPDALYVHLSGGVDGREAFIERLRSRATVYNSRETGDVTIRRFGDAVIVTGWSKIDILVKGIQKLLDTRFTRVYVKTDGRWLLASNQSGANTAAAG